MAADLTALRGAATTRSTPAELAKRGPTYWLRGRPIETDDAVVSLEMRSRITATFEAAATVSVECSREDYFVELPLGTNVVLTHQSVVSLAPTNSKPCGCRQRPATTARRAAPGVGVGAGGGNVVLDPDWCVVCSDPQPVVTQCEIGGHTVLCIEWVMNCENICETIEA
jgi:hypothetical protein